MTKIVHEVVEHAARAAAEAKRAEAERKALAEAQKIVAGAPGSAVMSLIDRCYRREPKLFKLGRQGRQSCTLSRRLSLRR